MKKLTALYLLAICFVLVSISSCTKVDDNTTSDLPDVTLFNVTNASGFFSGIASNITIQSLSLKGATYTIRYNLSGGTSATDQTANVTFNSSGFGTFSTIPLTSNAATTITVTAVTNGAGKTALVTSGNTKTAEVGAVTFTRNGTTYTSDMGYAALAGTLLNIVGTGNTTANNFLLNLYVNHYANAPITITNFNNLDDSASTSFAAGATALFGEHGTISITSTTPLLTGTFSFTGEDSSAFTSGRFSVPFR